MKNCIQIGLYNRTGIISKRIFNRGQRTFPHKTLLNPYGKNFEHFSELICESYKSVSIDSCINRGQKHASLFI